MQKINNLFTASVLNLLLVQAAISGDDLHKRRVVLAGNVFINLRALAADEPNGILMPLKDVFRLQSLQLGGFLLERDPALFEPDSPVATNFHPVREDSANVSEHSGTDRPRDAEGASVFHFLLFLGCFILGWITFGLRHYGWKR